MTFLPDEPPRITTAAECRAEALRLLARALDQTQQIGGRDVLATAANAYALLGGPIPETCLDGSPLPGGTPFRASSGRPQPYSHDWHVAREAELRATFTPPFQPGDPVSLLRQTGTVADGTVTLTLATGRVTEVRRCNPADNAPRGCPTWWVTAKAEEPSRTVATQEWSATGPYDAPWNPPAIDAWQIARPIPAKTGDPA